MRFQGFDPYGQPVRTQTAQPLTPQTLAPAPAPEPVAAPAEDDREDDQPIEEPGYGHGV
jgi:hypothetical protein